MTSEELKQLRHSAGLTQEGLARALEVTTSVITKWERGSRITPLAERAIKAFFREAKK